jgi:hypothetical protein
MPPEAALEVGGMDRRRPVDEAVCGGGGIGNYPVRPLRLRGYRGCKQGQGSRHLGRAGRS